MKNSLYSIYSDSQNVSFLYRDSCYTKSDIDKKISLLEKNFCNLLKDIENKKLFYDSKTILQEVVQGEHEQLTYVLLGETGPDHDKTFEAQVECDHRKLAVGTGKSKKQAEMEAARKALENLK